jgi:hypothetical protein
MTSSKSSSRNRARTGAAGSAEDATPNTTARTAPFPRRPSADAAGTAEYIAMITAELAAMAGCARLDMLTYFLNMARLEAEFHMRRQDQPS